MTEKNINLTEEESELLEGILLNVRENLSMDESLEFGSTITDIIEKLYI